VTEKYYRKGFGLKDEVSDVIDRDYQSNIIDLIKTNNHEMQIGRTRIRLAKEFGFCYGVDRSVEYAYQTVQKFPDKKIYLTGEIIHNPHVNKRLIDMGVKFLSGQYNKGETEEHINPEDVVILPAFGVSIPMLKRLREKDCILVDTTCGSVLLVWKHVEKFSKEGYTAIVHGKHYHEETIATVSRSADKYIVVLNEAEAQKVCDYILSPYDKTQFLNYFKGRTSPGFDPEADLIKIGVANQTTMLANESLKIAAMVKEALIERYGAEEIDQHFRAFDTICSATQERQDAIIELFKQKHDLSIIIGGFNSSNTKSLTAIALEHSPAFHIEDPDHLIDAQNIQHLPKGRHEAIISQGWLKEGPMTIAVTAGASTPNTKIGQVIEKILTIRGEKLPL
jgi:4-hydroxy-3-methylbut-2-enyl diphosphate reductase